MAINRPSAALPAARKPGLAPAGGSAKLPLGRGPAKPEPSKATETAEIASIDDILDLGDGSSESKTAPQTKPTAIAKPGLVPAKSGGNALPAPKPLAPRPQPVAVKPQPVSVKAQTVTVNVQTAANPRPITVTSETRVETANASAIDSGLQSLARRTTLEELARAGKTKNLKTLSERQLKAWITEALTRVISSSTSTIGAADQERLLAKTRDELTKVMAEQQSAAGERAADAAQLRTAIEERDALARRMAAAEAEKGGHAAELERRLRDAETRRDELARKAAELETRLDGVTDSSTIHLDDDGFAQLRSELAMARERSGALEAERAQLQRTLSGRLVATAEVVAALLALDRRYYNGTHTKGSTDGQTDAEATFFADEQAARTVADALARDLEQLHAKLADKVPDLSEDNGALAADLHRIDAMEWTKVQDGIIDDLQQQLDEAQQQQPAASPVADPRELNELKQKLSGRELELARLQGERDEAQRAANSGRDTIARLLREADQIKQAKAEGNGINTGRITAAESRVAAAERRGAEAERRAADADHKLADAELRLRAAEAKANDREAELFGAREARDAALSLSHNRQADDGAAARRSEETERRLQAAEQRHRDAERLLATRDQELTAARTAQGNASEAERRRIAAEAAQQAAERQAAQATSERDRLAGAVQAAEQARREAATARDGLRSENDALRRERDILAAARAAAPVPAPVPAPVAPGITATTDSGLREAVARLRTLTDEAPVPEEPAGTLVAPRRGQWLSAWRDNGRLHLARSGRKGWLTSNPGITGLASEPAVALRDGDTYATWRGQDGHARLVTLDGAGRPLGNPVDLGPSAAPPALARGGTTTFVCTTDHAGHLCLADPAQPGATTDLTVASGAPIAVGGPAAWGWAIEGTRHCAFRDARGSVHELFDLGGRWRHTDLTAQAGGPPAIEDPVGYAPGDHEHVLYRDANGHLNELCFDGRRWLHHDLTTLAGAPASAGRPSTGYLDGRHCVVYRGLDNQVHLLRLKRDWRHSVLHAIGRVDSDPSFASDGSEALVIATGSDGHRHAARFSDPAHVTVETLPG